MLPSRTLCAIGTSDTLGPHQREGAPFPLARSEVSQQNTHLHSSRVTACPAGRAPPHCHPSQTVNLPPSSRPAHRSPYLHNSRVAACPAGQAPPRCHPPPSSHKLEAADPHPRSFFLPFCPELLSTAPTCRLDMPLTCIIDVPPHVLQVKPLLTAPHQQLRVFGSKHRHPVTGDPSSSLIPTYKTHLRS